MSDREPFRVTLKVRHYELDTLGHLNHAVYHSYGEVARTELMDRAGGHRLRELNAAPVLLESSIRFRREVRGGDTVEVTCETVFRPTGKVFEMNTEIFRSDGVLAADIVCVLGVMDLDARKLLDDPRGRFLEAGIDLARLGAAE